MNWLDFVILGLLLVSMYWRLKTGIFVAAIYGIGILVGWRISGEVSQSIGELIGDALGLQSDSVKAVSELSGVNLSVDTTTTIVAYVIILILIVSYLNHLSEFVDP